MKKIISLGIASAVCAITAISASAAGIDVTYKGTIKKGSTIEIVVTAKATMADIQFNIDAVGLTIDSIGTPGATTLGVLSTDKKTYAASGFNMTTMETVPFVDGYVITTLKATVTGEPGSTVSLSFSDPDGVYTAYLPDGALTATVEADTTSSTPSDSSSTPSDSKPADSTPSDSKPDDKGDDKNPNGGVALAFGPAILAAAGAVVAKKRR